MRVAGNSENQKFTHDDIRDLCATLYSLLISSPPFASPPFDLHRKIAVVDSKELTAERLTTSGLPATIIRIIKKGLRNSNDCYAAARYLREDLEAFSNLQPLQHARESWKTAWLTSTQLWFRRSRKQALRTLATALLTFLAILFVVLWLGAEDEIWIARQHRDLKSALSGLHEGQPEVAARILESSEVSETFPWQFLRGQTDQTLFALEGFSANVVDAQLTDSPDTAWLLLANGTLHAVDIRTRETHRVYLPSFPTEPCTTLLVSNDAKTAVVLTFTGQIFVWSLDLRSVKMTNVFALTSATPLLPSTPNFQAFPTPKAIHSLHIRHEFFATKKTTDLPITKSRMLSNKLQHSLH